MNPETELINIMDFPGELYDSICDYLSHFSVALLRISFDQDIESVQLIGSGTLVIVNGYHSILTAEHVIAELRDSNKLGLLTSYRGNPHRYTFDQNHLNLHRIAKGTNDSDGPEGNGGRISDYKLSD